MIDRVIVEGYRFDQLMTDDEALEDFIRKAAIGVWHATCTCRMGAEDDPMAVTDNQGRVRGVAGLARRRRVAVPGGACANTNFPTLMTAEKISGSDRRRCVRTFTLTLFRKRGEGGARVSGRVRGSRSAERLDARVGCPVGKTYSMSSSLSTVAKKARSILPPV